MRKIKISLYLEPTQLRLINEVTKELRQKRAFILREAVNCYMALYARSKSELRK